MMEGFQWNVPRIACLIEWQFSLHLFSGTLLRYDPDMTFYVMVFSLGTGVEIVINIVAGFALYTKVHALCKHLFRRDPPQGTYRFRPAVGR